MREAKEESGSVLGNGRSERSLNQVREDFDVRSRVSSGAKPSEEGTVFWIS